MPSRIFAPELLQGQVIVVTGGGSGLGRATAQELTACGATVVIAGRRLEPLEETASLCEGTCEPVVCDIRDEEQVGGFVDGVLERHGRIDTLVNNAGGQYMTPAEDISSKGFETVVRLNLIGTWLMTHAVATKAPDGLGLFDLFGNAAEWVVTRDGQLATRGGSFRDGPEGIGPAARAVQDEYWNERDPQLPKSRWWLSDGPFVGFRLVREIQ